MSPTRIVVLRKIFLTINILFSSFLLLLGVIQNSVLISMLGFGLAAILLLLLFIELDYNK